jgi:alcohol dehydrogenase
VKLSPFRIARLPALEFGEGEVRRLPELASAYGRRALIVAGRRSLRGSPRWSELLAGFERQGLSWESLAVENEPSPRRVDEAVAALRGEAIDVVVGIGGGSALDAAKAIAGMLPHGNSVMDHLEGVGRGMPYCGPSVPFIASPTTAGTGSEATKNAVLSEQRRDGFKKSFRHDCLVARHAVVDPELLESCPPELIAADGMDALTQLIESFVSRRANPMTDALALSGLKAAREGLWAWLDGGPRAAEGRRRMAYAALLSGITLAQTGLGAVHGLASPLGAQFPIPHGVVCGTLLAASTAANIRALERREPGHPALARYARLGSLLGRRDHGDRATARRALIELLESWTRRLDLPLLSRYGVGRDDVDGLVADSRGSSMKTNPIVLTDGEIAEILRQRI